MNAKKLSYKELQKKCEELEGAYERLEADYKELIDRFIFVVEHGTEKLRKKFVKSLKSIDIDKIQNRINNRKPTKKDLEKAGKIIEKHRKNVEGLLVECEKRNLNNKKSLAS